MNQWQQFRKRLCVALRVGITRQSSNDSPIHHVVVLEVLENDHFIRLVHREEEHELIADVDPLQMLFGGLEIFEMVGVRGNLRNLFIDGREEGRIPLSKPQEFLVEVFSHRNGIHLL